MISNSDSVGTLAKVGSVSSSDAICLSKSNKHMEVLAPAGGPESVIAAVRSGADAVYFGAPGFNARRNAHNFTREEMTETIAFCKTRGVKTYLTLNTLVSDSEMQDALNEAKFAFNAGIDAVIVQDLGLANLLHENLPMLPLHASTQMSVHSALALPVLKRLGFCRVVPAREMDKTSLIEFCKEAKKLGIEVEVFVHGALCICLSGQCYLSALLGGRSGNRGLCAGPCRLEFSVENGTGHDLSLKDMSVLEHIDELREMGVCSLKIEGRMKRPEYVAAAVAVTRAKVDGSEVSDDTEKLLSGIFSRSGHTDGYFTADYKDMFGVRTDNDERLSLELINTAHELYRRDRQSVALDISFVLKRGQAASLTLSDGDGHTVTVFGQTAIDAKNVPLTVDGTRERLAKLGGTCYYLKDFEAKIDEQLFLSGADINSLRREAVELLDQKRSKLEKTLSVEMAVPEICRRSAKRSDIVACFKDVSQIPKSLTGVKAVVLPVETDFSQVNLPDVILIADLPRAIMHSTQKYKQALTDAVANGVKAVNVGNLAGLLLANELNVPVVAGIGMNVFNSYSVNTLQKLGVSAVVASFELTAQSIKSLGGSLPIGAVSYGRLPLMIFKNCPGKNGAGCAACGGKTKLTDRKGIEFPVMCRGEFSEMFNSRVLWNFDRKRDLGVDFEILYFTDETKERCAEILSAAKLEKSPDCEYTRGLYYRGVQ